MDSKNVARFLRALAAGDFKFEAPTHPSHRAASGLALFIAGTGAGVLLGMLMAPSLRQPVPVDVPGAERAHPETEEFPRKEKAAPTHRGAIFSGKGVAS